MLQPFRKIYFYILSNRLVALLFLLALSTLFFTPLGAKAIFFLILMPTLLGEVIITMILEALFWCAVGVLCPNNEAPPADAVAVSICDPIRSAEHALMTPSIVMNASFVSTSTAWGTSIYTPGPTDQLQLTWTSANATECYFSTSLDPTETQTEILGSDTIIPGDSAPPGQAVSITLRCVNSNCNFNTTDTQSFTIPLPNLSSASAFTVFPNIVRYEGTTRFGWDILADNRTPYPMNCQIKGPLTTPYSFDASSIRNGNLITQAVTNNSLSSLSCTEPVSGAVYTSTEKIEVIPRVYEL